MDYLIRVTQGEKLLGEEIAFAPQEEGFLAEILQKIMLPVRKAASGLVGEYIVKVTEVPSGVLNTK